MSKYKTLVLPADKFGCGWWRCLQPYAKIRNVSDKVSFDIFDPNKASTIPYILLGAYDTFLFQRPTHKDVIETMRKLKASGKKVVVETDDLLTNIEPDNYCFQHFNQNGKERIKNYIEGLKIADAVHVSTPELAEEVKRYNKNVHVFLNAIDFDKKYYENRMPRIQVDGIPVDKTILFWAGSLTHKASLTLIKQSIEDAVKQTDSVFVFCSEKNFFESFDFKIEKDKLIYCPPINDVTKYSPIMSLGDINLTPVVDNKFNNCKSWLKCIETGVYGIPSISSPVAPYKLFNSFYGGNIIVKKNRHSEWTKEIVNLINDRDKREELGLLAKKTVSEYANLDKINEKRLLFWEDLLK